MKDYPDLSDICLKYPVHTISNKLLLPPGARLDAKTIASLQANNQNNDRYATVRIMMYDSLLDDFFQIIESYKHYGIIFSNEQQVWNMLAIIKDIEVPEPVIAYLEYFKLNDFYTYRHIILVFALSTLLAMDLIAERNLILEASIAGPIHDFGKLCTPIPVLTKTTRLTNEEKAQLEHHAVAGFVLLTYYFPKTHYLSGLVALQHHERRDGSGYPQGIHLNDLMVEIVMACDIYDALVSPRPYRPTSFDNRSALEELTRMAKQKKVRWDIVRALIAKNRKHHPSFRECSISEEIRGKVPTGNLYGEFSGKTNE